MEDLYFNGEKLTKENILKTEQWFINNAQGCIDEVLSGEVRVNNIDSYVSREKERIEIYRNKTYKISLTFLQKAYYIQTGKSIALLP